MLEKFGFICYSKQTGQIRFDSPMTLVPTTLFFFHTIVFHAIVSITSQHNYSKHNFIIIIYNYHFNTRLLTSILALRCICQLNIVIAQMFNHSIYNLSPLSVGGKPLKTKKDCPGQSSKCIYIYI